MKIIQFFKDIKNFFLKCFRQVIIIRNRKKSIIRSLKKFQRILKSGIWLVNFNFSKNLLFNKLPDSFYNAKKNRIDLRYRPFIGRLVKLIDIIIPPYFTIIFRFKKRNKITLKNRQFTTLLISSSGNEIFINPRDSKLIRTFRAKEDLILEVNARSELECCFSIPNWQINNTHFYIEEKLMNGISLVDLSSNNRILVYKNLIENYIKHCAHKALKYDNELWPRIIKWAYSCPDLPADCKEELIEYGNIIVSCGSQWPCIFGHGDLYHNNIIVIEEQLKPVLIDFDNSTYLPFFYDLLTLAHNEFLNGRKDIYNALESGLFNIQLKKLKEVINAVNDDVLNFKVMFLAHFLYKAYKNIDSIKEYKIPS